MLVWRGGGIPRLFCANKRKHDVFLAYFYARFKNIFKLFRNVLKTKQIKLINNCLNT